MDGMGPFWDERARENSTSAICYHATEEDFERYGREEAEYLERLMQASMADRYALGEDTPDHKRSIDAAIAASEILDVGGGKGRVATYLAHRVGTYHLLDVSAEMLRQAKERMADLGDRVQYHHTDGIHYPPEIVDASLDFAFSDLCFQHIDREIVLYHLCEIHRRLKWGAWFWLQVPPMRYPERFEDAYRGDWPAHLHRWQPGDLLELVVRIGYRVIAANLDSMQVILAKDQGTRPGWLAGRGE